MNAFRIARTIWQTLGMPLIFLSLAPSLELRLYSLSLERLLAILAEISTGIGAEVARKGPPGTKQRCAVSGSLQLVQYEVRPQGSRS